MLYLNSAIVEDAGDTRHQIIFNNSNKMNTIPSDSIALMVTSPPYPMIEMWEHMLLWNTNTFLLFEKVK
jgi:DNA modification methylase